MHDLQRKIINAPNNFYIPGQSKDETLMQNEGESSTLISNDRFKAYATGSRIEEEERVTLSTVPRFRGRRAPTEGPTQNQDGSETQPGLRQQKFSGSEVPQQHRNVPRRSVTSISGPSKKRSQPGPQGLAGPWKSSGHQASLSSVSPGIFEKLASCFE